MLYKILSPNNTVTMIVYHPKKGCLPPQEGLFTIPRRVVWEIPMGRVDLKMQNFLKEKTTINSDEVLEGWNQKNSFVEATCKGMVIFCNNLLDSLVPTSIIK